MLRCVFVFVLYPKTLKTQTYPGDVSRYNADIQLGYKAKTYPGDVSRYKNADYSYWLGYKAKTLKTQTYPGDVLYQDTKTKTL